MLKKLSIGNYREESLNSHLVIDWFTLQEGCLPSNMNKLIEHKRLRKKHFRRQGFVGARASRYEYICI